MLEIKQRSLDECYWNAMDGFADRFVTQHAELHPKWRKAYRRASRHRNRDWLE